MIAEGGDAAGVSTVIGYDRVTIITGGTAFDPLSVERPVATRGFNFGVYVAVTELVARYVRGDLPLSGITTQLRSLDASRGPYPGWLTRLAAGFAGGSASLIFGGGALVAGCGFAANLVIDWLFAVLGRRGWPVFFLQILTGLVAGGSAWALRAARPQANASARTWPVRAARSGGPYSLRTSRRRA